MPKKTLHQKPNLQDETTKLIESSELLNKILKAGKEEKLKIIEGMLLEYYPYWMYMKTNLSADYFIPDKNDGSKSDNDNKLLFGQSSLENVQIKGKKNFNGINGVNYVQKSAKISLANNVKRPFPNTLEGLEKEFNELKGKSLSYHDTLRKKGIYSRIIKKKRKEERTILKKGNNTNLAFGKKGNKIKIKPVKRILNNEGKVVSSKFDFSQNEIKTLNKTSEAVLTNDISEGNTINPTSPGKNKLINDLNGNLGLESNGINHFEKKAKILNASENKVEHVKQENKLSFEPVFNKESKMVFSKFEFSDKKNRVKNKKEEKDPIKILEKLKLKEANLKKLEASGNKDKAQELKEKEKWAIALKKASGEKVKDDPELLKKSVRREKHKKLHSKQKWEARIAEVQKGKQEKQQKRSTNINARKTEKKKKKMKRAVKKGRFPA